MKKFKAFSLSLAGIVLLIPILYGQVSAGQSGNATSIKESSTADIGHKRAVETFKNIQILKQISGDELVPAMQFITASLGVECGFCHVEGAFDKDDKKPKQTAREMMKMMISINADNFDGHREVTCFTCHRGASKPVSIPIISNEAVNPVTPESAKNSGPTLALINTISAALPSIDSILEKYVQALGGETAIGTLSTLVEAGTATLGAHKFPIEIFDKNPNQRSSVIHLPDGDLITTYDGKEIWTSTSGHPIRTMSSSDRELAKLDANLQFAINLKQIFGELKVDRQENVRDRKAYVILGLAKGIPPVQLYFDVSSGLLVRDVRYIESPLGMNPVQTDYFDYQEVGGVKVPFHWIVSRPNSHFEIRVTKAQPNVSIDQSKFAKPTAPIQN